MPATLRNIIRNEPYKNILINGNMRHWQRGVNVTASSVSGYRGPDRFQIRASGTSATSSVIRVTDVPTPQFDYSLELTETGDATGNSIVLGQKIEAKNIKKLVGQEVTLSFWVKNENFAVPYNARVYSPISATEDSWGADMAGEQEELVLENSFSLTLGVWTKKTYTFTVPAACVNGMMVWLSSDAYTGVPTTKTTGWMLNEGSLSEDFRLFADNEQEELEICKRYFEKGGYQTEDSYPGSAIGWRGMILGSEQISSRFQGAHFTVMKRAIPTVVIYGATSDVSAEVINISANFGTGASLGTTVAFVTGVGANGFRDIDAASATANGAMYRYTADAEL